MKPVKTYTEYKALFGDRYSNNYLDSLRLVYAVSTLNEMLGDDNGIVDDEFIMRIAHENSGVAWMYNPRKRSLVDFNLRDEKSYNSIILMDDVAEILREASTEINGQQKNF